MKTYKLTKEDKELIEIAGEISKKSRKIQNSGETGSALLSKSGKIHKGISLNIYCGIGTCGEHGAICSLMVDDSNEIDTIVAVYYDRKKNKNIVLPPCGRCRETMYQINKKNLDCWVILSNTKKVKLHELLPFTWKEIFGERG